jgi:hypothetical protein
MQNSKQHVCKMYVRQLPTRVNFGVTEWQMGGVELCQTVWLLFLAASRVRNAR